MADDALCSHTDCLHGAVSQCEPCGASYCLNHAHHPDHELPA